MMASKSLREIEGYLQALFRVRSAVLRCCPGTEGLAGLLSLRRSRVIEKTGVICEGLEYDFHGSGCLFVEVDGSEVDIDFLEEGQEVFDAWRVRRFSVSVGKESSGSLEDISAECRSLVSRGRLAEPRDGWFSVVL